MLILIQNSKDKLLFWPRKRTNSVVVSFRSLAHGTSFLWWWWGGGGGGGGTDESAEKLVLNAGGRRLVWELDKDRPPPGGRATDQ
jgi:hypothetical protein